MIGASSASGDTLIACHFPLVQLPTWQLPVQTLCSSAKRPSRLFSLGLTRAVSLPEQDSLNHEHAFTCGRQHFSSSHGSLNEDRVEEEAGSDSSGRYDSTSSPEEMSSRSKESSGARGSVRPHNSFLPNTEHDEDEEDEDSDGGNLHRYHEDSSFVLQGNSSWPLSSRVVTENCAMSHGNVGTEWGSKGTILGDDSDVECLSNQPNQLYSLEKECRCFHMSTSGTKTNDEEESNGPKDNISCCTHGQHKCSPDLYSHNHTDNVSDSSCNSSDGILVNFCTIYKRSNNPATPLDLNSPVLPPLQSSEGSVFLNLQPIPPAEEEVYTTPFASCWSPQGLDSNCNLYSVEPLPQGLSSLEVSDLTACLQSQATLTMGTNQKYYKLVTCDLSSQSPSPAWSYNGSCPEGQGRSSPFLPSEKHVFDQKKEQHQKELKKEDHQTKETSFSSAQFDCSQFCDYQAANTSTEKDLCRQKHADSIQNFSLCPSQSSPQSSKTHDSSIALAHTSVTVDQEHCDAGTVEKGVCSLENEVARYSKAQRPTSLPIQPFVLVPTDKPEAQHLGCLLEQYMNQKSNKSSTSKSGSQFKGKRSQCFSTLQLSPMGSHYPVFLALPSSSDTCSSCTPSPEWVGRRHTWSQSSRMQGRPSPCTSTSSLDPSQSNLKPTKDQVVEKTSPHSGQSQTSTILNLSQVSNQCNLFKIPTYQDLINITPMQNHSIEPNLSHTSYQSLFSHTPPTLPLTVDSHHPSPPARSQPEKKLPPLPPRAAPADDSGFFRGSFTAALSSVASLSSLSSLLSFAAPTRLSQASDSLVLSDKPPAEFCLSPEMSYESMSISHLQRRGLLRCVSRAVDMIMAHFGSSRDPEEKVRLGNSSRSPTVAGLVLEHLCPAILNILEDGLRDHKLDVIIGQRRNHPWSVVEVSARIGPSTKVLHKLVCKIRLCPQLNTHCMRLRAFIMGLLNLRALEFWLSHLQSLKDVVTTNYHSWGFLSMSLGQCQLLFQELLLLLQPLSALPFDLNLLLEPRLLRNRQLCPEDGGASPPPSCSALLATSWPLLQADRKAEGSCGGRPNSQARVPHQQTQECVERWRNMSQELAPAPGWCPTPPIIENVFEEVDCSQNNADNWSQISMCSRQEEQKEDNERPEGTTRVLAERPGQSRLRWAKLFGAADTCNRTDPQSPTEAQSRRYRRPSEWLHLDRSQFGMLAQSIRSIKLKGAQTDKDC